MSLENGAANSSSGEVVAPPTDPEWPIRVRGLHKTFGDHHVLRGVDLDVQRGKINVIIGGSGQGKTVLMKHLMALIAPDAGGIWVDGEDITTVRDANAVARIRRKFGMVFQYGALFDSMTVAENIAFPLIERYRLPRKEILERVRTLLVRLDISSTETKFPSQISGGQRKRVALARAVIDRPQMLLYDEPTTGLDPVVITPAVAGVEFRDQKSLDEAIKGLDGTPNKEKLGANALLGVSMAFARASAASQRTPLRSYLGPGSVLPVPMFNILNGGAHADNSVDFQEFMVGPVGAPSFREALRMGAETYHALKSILKQKGLSTGVGDEGGFAPNLSSNVQAIELILEAIEKASLQAGSDVVLCLDPAASEFYKDGAYVFHKSDGSRHSSAEMVDFWAGWVRQYPIWLLEDGLAEDDWEGWKLLTEALGRKIRLVGDDIFVTNPTIIKRAIEWKVANATLIKLNQIGTVSETLEAIAIGKAAKYGNMISHRSGETADDFIADLAVGTAVGMIKTGAPCRGERLAKYNQLLRLEEELGDRGRYAGAAPFKVA